MKKALYGIHSGTAYLIGMGSLLYLMGFLIDFPLPKTIDGGISAPLPPGPMTNLALIVAFLVPHSIMARPRFKAWWTRIVPAALERSTYVLCSGVTTLLLMWAWQPMPQPVWSIVDPAGRIVLFAVYGMGWTIIVLATFQLDHLAFFGLRQAWDALHSRTPRSVPFTAKWLYGLVRHPINVGWLLVFWASPTMTQGHLLFACVICLYIAIVTPVEEADLIAHLGDQYRRYRDRVPAFVPYPRKQARRRTSIARPA